MADAFSAPRPAMPSRATVTLAEELVGGHLIKPEPMFEAPTEKPKQRRKRKPGALSVAEIKKIKAKRARVLRAKAAPKQASRVQVKNPNRPLELKSQLEAVLMLTTVLKKPELEAFATIAGTMQKLSRGGRKNVIGALERVYL